MTLDELALSVAQGQYTVFSAHVTERLNLSRGEKMIGSGEWRAARRDMFQDCVDNIGSTDEDG